MRKNISTAVLLAAIVTVQYWIWANPQGIISLVETRNKLLSKKQRAQLLYEQNRKLKEEIEHLKSDDKATEMRARSDLGMIKDGETYYQVNFKDVSSENGEALKPIDDSNITEDTEKDASKNSR